MPFTLATRLSPSITSEYAFTLQTDAFITSDEIVLLTQITLETNMFIARDERILCWGQTL